MTLGSGILSECMYVPPLFFWRSHPFSRFCGGYRSLFPNFLHKIAAFHTCRVLHTDSVLRTHCLSIATYCNMARRWCQRAPYGKYCAGWETEKREKQKRRVYSLWCIPGAEKGINCYIQRMQEVFVGLIPESLTQIRQNIIDVLCPYGKAYGVGLDSLL